MSNQIRIKSFGKGNAVINASLLHAAHKKQKNHDQCGTQLQLFQLDDKSIVLTQLESLTETIMRVPKIVTYIATQ